MSEITTRHAPVLSVGPPVLVARWGLVVVAAILWLTVVPLVSVASDLRRLFTS